MTTKQCAMSGCTDEALPGKRFCRICEKIVKDRMKSSGYLQRVQRHGTNRTSEQMEVTRDTKFGREG